MKKTKQKRGLLFIIQRTKFKTMIKVLPTFNPVFRPEKEKSEKYDQAIE